LKSIVIPPSNPFIADSAFPSTRLTLSVSWSSGVWNNPLRTEGCRLIRWCWAYKSKNRWNWWQDRTWARWSRERCGSWRARFVWQLHHRERTRNAFRESTKRWCNLNRNDSMSAMAIYRNELMSVSGLPHGLGGKSEQNFGDCLR
jgi:hypothetical protein